MRLTIKKKESKKLICMLLFMSAYFLQAYIDGKYTAYNIEPGILTALKYGLFCMGIFLGFTLLSGKKKFIYIKETLSVLFSIFVFLIISMVLNVFNSGDIKTCVELIFRFTITVLYAFVLLNMLNFNEIYFLMSFLLFVSIWGWILQKGPELLNLGNLVFSFAESYSPFESDYFAAASINCCAFFMYYRKNKMISAISIVFVFITFKRPAILFSLVFLILPRIINVNQQIKKTFLMVWKIAIILSTICYLNLLLPEGEELLQKFTGMSAAKFTMGRSTILREVLATGYTSAGLGSTNCLVGHVIEMDLIQILLETTIIGLVVFIFCYTYTAGNKLYSILIMTFQMFTCLTGSGLYNSFGWVPIFLTLGCISYLKENEPCRRTIFKRRKQRGTYE